MPVDLIVEGGRVVDPARGIDRKLDVAFDKGRVHSLGEKLTLEAATRIDGRGKIVTPGLIDFHSHVYWGGTWLGLDAASLAKRAGTTTWLDVGSAGPGNFKGFAAHVIERSPVRILAYLHISFAGIYGFSDRIEVGESDDMRLLNPKLCAEVAKEWPGLILGIKVRVGRFASGYNGIAPLELALEAADLAGLPLMCHIDEPPPSIEAVVAMLRPGDTLTHCFRPSPNAPHDGKGRARDALIAARERGVYFDIGHGMGSFSFESAETMLREGFAPDIVSTDLHALCVDGPAYDLPHVMTKLHAAGMGEVDVVRSVTATPARALARPDLADLSPGSIGDCALLEWVEEETTLVDVKGVERIAPRRLGAAGLIKDGAIFA